MQEHRVYRAVLLVGFVPPRYVVRQWLGLLTAGPLGLKWRVKCASGRPAEGLLMLALLLPSTAHANLDPGTGSYVVQLLIGIVLGGLFALGVFWRRVVASVQRLFKRRIGNDGSR